MINEAILKKVQAIYGAPSMESLNPLNESGEPAVEDVVIPEDSEISAFEGYSSEELELLHNEMVEEYVDSMETITTELANLELTIMLESVGLSLAEFNKYEGKLSLEGVKESVKDGKTTGDSAFKSILKRIISLFGTMIDMITGNYINILKYGKLVLKYRQKLSQAETKIDPDKKFSFSPYVGIKPEFSKILEENSDIFKQFKMLGSSASSPKSIMGGIYQLFGKIGVKINTDGAEQFAAKLKSLDGALYVSKEVSAAKPNEVRESLISDANTIIKSLKGLPKNFKEQSKAIKKKLNDAKALEKAKPESEGINKKAIQDDLNRCIKLIGEYKSYNKKCTQLVKKAINAYLTSVGSFLDAMGVKAVKEKDTETKEETK